MLHPFKHILNVNILHYTKISLKIQIDSYPYRYVHATKLYNLINSIFENLNQLKPIITLATLEVMIWSSTQVTIDFKGYQNTEALLLNLGRVKIFPVWKQKKKSPNDKTNQNYYFFSFSCPILLLAKRNLSGFQKAQHLYHKK